MKRSAHIFLLFSLLLVLVMGAGGSAWAQSPDDKPQVRVEARILEWQISNGLDFDFAVNYTPVGGSSILKMLDLTLPSEPSLGSATRLFFDGLDVAGGNFDVVIEALETAGEVESLAKPSIILTSREIAADQVTDMSLSGNRDAKITNNMEIPYESAAAAGNRLISFTEYKKSGLTLDVSVLKVYENGDVLLDLSTTVSDLTGFIRVGLNERNEPMSVPAFDTRSITNRIVVPNGTVFLAGLMKTTRDTKRRRGVPWLSEIPLIDWVTASRRNQYEDTELVFLIKPEILGAEGEKMAAMNPDTPPQPPQPNNQQQ